MNSRVIPPPLFIFVISGAPLGCKLRCREMKIAGSINALTRMMRWASQQTNCGGGVGGGCDSILVASMQAVASSLLLSEQRPAGVTAAVPPASCTSTVAAVAAASPRVVAGPPPEDGQGSYGEPIDGWADVDRMYIEPEFKAGCLAFTQFYKGNISRPALRTHTHTHAYTHTHMHFTFFLRFVLPHFNWSAIGRFP